MKSKAKYKCRVNFELRNTVESQMPALRLNGQSAFLIFLCRLGMRDSEREEFC